MRAPGAFLTGLVAALGHAFAFGIAITNARAGCIIAGFRFASAYGEPHHPAASRPSLSGASRP